MSQAYQLICFDIKDHFSLNEMTIERISIALNLKICGEFMRKLVI